MTGEKREMRIKEEGRRCEERRIKEE